jgi:hypothetical protein
LAQPFKILTGLRGREFIVTDNFERRDDKTFWQVSCVFCGAKKYASTSQIRRNGIGRCKCQKKANQEPSKPDKSELPEAKKRRKRQFAFKESEAVALLLEYRRTNDEWIFADFIKLVDPLSEVILNKRGLHERTHRDEVMNSIRLKIWKSFRL